MTFGAHICSEPFLDNLYEIWQLLSALYSDVWKKLYSCTAHCTSMFSALNYCSGSFFKSLSHLYKVGCTNFSANFWTFRNFWPQFREHCGATLNFRASERAITSENGENRIKLDSQTATHYFFKVCPHQVNSTQALEHDKQTYKHHIFTPTAGACLISPKLHGVKRSLCPL